MEERNKIRQLSECLEHIKDSRAEFIENLLKAFEKDHPEFIEQLKERGLNEMARLPSCERRWTRFDYNHYLRKAEMPDRVGHDDKTNGGLTKNERNEQIYLQSISSINPEHILSMHCGWRHDFL